MGDSESGEEGPVQIEGEDVDDADVQDILTENMEQARHPVTLSTLDDILYRKNACQKTLRSSRSPTALQGSLAKLQDIVVAVGGAISWVQEQIKTAWQKLDWIRRLIWRRCLRVLMM